MHIATFKLSESVKWLREESYVVSPFCKNCLVKKTKQWLLQCWKSKNRCVTYSQSR